MLALACVVWGLVLLLQRQTSPARQHLEAGIAFDHQGRYDEAIREWREAARLDPNLADAWRLLGYASISADRWPDAVAAFRQLRRLDPNDPELAISLATCTFRAGDFPAALNYAQEALKRNPDDVGALAIAAYCSPAMGDQTERLDYLRRLVKRQPDDVDYLLMLAYPLTTRLQFAEARPLVDHILTLDPRNAQACALRGFIRLTESPSPQALAAAETDLRRALELDPLNYFALFHLGRVCKLKGQPAQAIPLLEKAAQLAPNRHQTYYELAEAYQQTGNTRMAALARSRFEALRNQRDRESLLEKRVIAFPDDFDSNLEFGVLLLEKGDLQKARVCLERAKTLRPEDARARSAFQELVALTGGAGRAADPAGLSRKP
jgi:tetratricopeptide (TPR) repeat protein